MGLREVGRMGGGGGGGGGGGHSAKEGQNPLAECVTPDRARLQNLL